MAYIKETVEHESGTVIEVLEKERGESRDPWMIIDLDTPAMSSYSPKELRSLGKWLIQQGKRIGKEYKSNGKLRISDING